MKYVFELPFYSPFVGGITSTIALAKEMGADIHFQQLTHGYPYGLGVNFTSGNTYPMCDVIITYSDNPHTQRLLKLSPKPKVAIYFQSYGMSYHNERMNLINSNVFPNFCSTQKIANAIIDEGYTPTNIGFGLEMSEFEDYGFSRKNYLAIMYHDMPSKRYDIAVQVADILYDKGIIEGVISFGSNERYNKHKHPKGLVKHYGNATKIQVARVFNQCKAYLMPSVSEGLNLTPIESTLCGCPAIIVDGAIGEIFNDYNCKIVDSDSIVNMQYMIAGMVVNDRYSELFKENMQEIIKPYIWKSVADKLKQLL